MSKKKTTTKTTTLKEPYEISYSFESQPSPPDRMWLAHTVWYGFIILAALSYGGLVVGLFLKCREAFWPIVLVPVSVAALIGIMNAVFWAADKRGS